MFAGQQAYQTWPQPLPPPDDPGPDTRGTECVDAKLNGVASGTRRSLELPIVLGVVLGLAALGLVGFLGTLLLRPGAAPKTAAALSAPGSTLPPLAEATSNLPSQTIEPERAPSGGEPPPIQFGASQQASLESVPPSESTTILAPSAVPSPPARDSGATDILAPLPPPRPLPFTPGPSVIPAPGYDKWTAVYDISAHTVYLPDGTHLEAHSGLGGDRDDPRFVDERDRGATPPHLYELTLRESLFHGVQALRLTPIGEGFSFDRTGLLAHPYMLGPNGDSNGCVSFKNYDAFLRAFQSGEVRHLAVVARWTEDPRQLGRFASLRQGVDR
jgi:Protein of unknown function (DUF2778)